MKLSKTLIASGVMALAISGTAMAWSGGHDRHNLADKLDHIVDLTDEQEALIEQIQHDNRAQFKAQYGDEEFGRHKGKRGKGGVAAFMKLDPASPDFINQSEQLAEKMSEKVKAKIITRAQTMQQVYAILTPEQQQALQVKRSNMLEKIAKREARHKDQRDD